MAHIEEALLCLAAALELLLLCRELCLQGGALFPQCLTLCCGRLCVAHEAHAVLQRRVGRPQRRRLGPQRRRVAPRQGVVAQVQHLGHSRVKVAQLPAHRLGHSHRLRQPRTLGTRSGITLRGSSGLR
jgi:hypothetical protein